MLTWVKKLSTKLRSVVGLPLPPPEYWNPNPQEWKARVMNNLIISPTGLGIRSDSAGHGAYLASRGNRLHQGLDFLCKPGQRIYCPIDEAAKVRTARPYDDLSYDGVLLRNPFFEIFLFYFSPSDTINNKSLSQGCVIGTAQDITKRYDLPAMQPHIHLEIKSADPNLFSGGF